MTKHPLTDEQKENIRQGVLKFYDSPAGQIEKAAKKGKAPGNKGKPGPDPWNKGLQGVYKATPETRQKIANTRIKKAVIQYTKTMKVVRRWPSMAEASRALNIALSSISSCCSYRIKSTGGYIWRFDEK
jgi:hypothetical protein